MKKKEDLFNLNNGDYCWSCLIANNYRYADKEDCICSCHKVSTKSIDK